MSFAKSQKVNNLTPKKAFKYYLADFSAKEKFCKKTSSRILFAKTNLEKSMILR